MNLARTMAAAAPSGCLELRPVNLYPGLSKYLSSWRSSPTIGIWALPNDLGSYMDVHVCIWVVVKTMVPFWVPKILGAVLY